MSGINVSVDNEMENHSYLQYKLGLLDGVKKDLILMIDEVHIKPKAEFHLEYGIHGIDAEQKVARTIIAFMVKSIFGSYKEVVKLVPKFQTTSFDLQLNAMKVIRKIEELGGRVVAMVTDNARININMYRSLGFAHLATSRTF